MSTILAVTECRDGKLHKTSLEVVTQAKALSEKIGGGVVALVIGSGINAESASLGEYGATKVLVADDKALENYQPDLYKSIILEAIRQNSADIVLAPATAIGKDVMPRVAARLEAGMVSDCTKILVQDNTLQVEHPIFAGKAFALLSMNSVVKIITLRPSVFDAFRTNPGAIAPIEKIGLPAIETKVKTREVKKTGGNKLDVADADIIVTGGRGLRAAENFKIIEDLAAYLNAAVGATRAAVDSGWRPHEEQVGQTGKVVSPNLYIMCGASGSIQHWAGMSGAKCIVAVNKDPNAPIIQRADYSIIGDLFEVVPALIEEIRKIRG
jgi:electron transfer flavoprotein alpha subunit